jgi:hypothetical protein
MQKIVEVVVNKPKSKMGGMGKLSQFSGIKQSPAPVDIEADRVPAQDPPVEAATLANSKEKLVAVNFKITRNQQEWLADTARLVRDNNAQAVPPAERVYPQHLMGVAISLLQQADVDWSQIKNVEQLRKQLNLLDL